MKLKQVRALLTALALVVGTTLCVSTVSWAKSLNPDPISIINDDGTIIKSAIQSDRTLYLGSTQAQDIQSDILERLCTASHIKEDKLTANDVNITLKSELIFDEDKNEYVESDNDIKDVMTLKDNTVTFSRTGFFLAEVSIKDEKCNVIFDVDKEILAYADLNDWVMLNKTSNPDFSVEFDNTKIKGITFDDSKIKTNLDGEYVLTYVITDVSGKTYQKDVLVTVGDKKVVNELSEKGVWVAEKKIVANNSNTTKPVVKPENKPDSNNGSNNQNNNQSSNQDNNKPNKPEKPQHVHAFGDWQVKKAATCDKTGLEERFCTDTTCNKKEVRKTPALGHALTETVITEPTCGTAGSKEITCSRCDYKETKEIPATGKHAYGDWVVVKEATCEQDGQKTRVCSVCQHVDTEILVKLGHDFVDYKQDEIPTCTENGTEIGHCSRCDKEDVKIIEKLGHKYDNGAVTTEPTCETDGVMTYTCVRKGCRTQYDEHIAKLGHEFVDYKYNNDATCEKDGTETAKCTRCDKTDTRVAEGTKLGHELKEEILTNPTCETAGSKKITCSRCDYEEIVEIPAIGHKWNDGEVTTAPTCTTEGVKTFTCQNDKSHTRTEVVPALGHDLKEEIVKAPTCTETGSKKVTCTRCDYEDSQVEIPALGHKWDDGVVTKAPTCTETGVKTFTCQNDKNHTRTEVIPATGHDLKEEVIKPATCTEKGQVRVFCTKCDFEEIKETESFGHDMDEGVVTTPATCTTDGVRTYTCRNNCGHTTTEVIPATGHDIKEEPIKDATCTEKGQVKAYCTRGDFEEIRETAALGHDMTAWNQVTPPTCLIEGTQERHCNRCNHRETESVGVIPHNWTNDYETKWVGYYECKKCHFQTEDGDEMGLHCLDCGSRYETKKRQENVLVGHHCTECGTKDY